MMTLSDNIKRLFLLLYIQNSSVPLKDMQKNPNIWCLEIIASNTS